MATANISGNWAIRNLFEEIFSKRLSKRAFPKDYDPAYLLLQVLAFLARAVESALKSAAMTMSNKSKDARKITREYVASF